MFAASAQFARQHFADEHWLDGHWRSPSAIEVLDDLEVIEADVLEVRDTLDVLGGAQVLEVVDILEVGVNDLEVIDTVDVVAEELEAAYAAKVVVPISVLEHS